MNVALVVLHRNRHIGASERRQLIPHVRFQVPFLGPESQSGFACAGLLCDAAEPELSYLKGWFAHVVNFLQLRIRIYRGSRNINNGSPFCREMLTYLHHASYEEYENASSMLHLVDGLSSDADCSCCHNSGRM